MGESRLSRATAILLGAITTLLVVLLGVVQWLAIDTVLSANVAAVVQPTRSEPGWVVMVSWEDVATGTCLGADNYLDLDDEELTTVFRAETEYFTAVSCAGAHAAEVVRRVPVPADTEWAEFGFRGGKTVDDARDLMTGVCDAADSLLADDPALESVTFEVVAAVDSTPDDLDLLGLCIAVFSGPVAGNVSVSEALATYVSG